MNKPINTFLLSSLLILVLVAGCSPAAATNLPAAELAVTRAPSPTPRPTTVKAAMPIAVTPFYDSVGPQISVGDYSQRLGITDLAELNILAQEMAKQKHTLTPEEMYVLAIRFYDLGDRDQSVYWYYEAQFRAKLFQQAIEPAQMVRVGDPAFELNTAYQSFQQLAGDFINGYAGCDLDNWVRITTVVMTDNPNPPELDQLFPEVVFVDRNQWQEINNNVVTGLAVLINYISENGESIKMQRAQSDMDAKYCN
jgi:hypothetical protein